MSETVRVTLRHMRKAQMCRQGTADWFRRQWPADWSDRWYAFRHGGIPAEWFEQSGDAMAIRLAQVAREEAAQDGR